MSFATPYVGRRDLHCWELVRIIYEQHCGISLPHYGDIDADELDSVARAVEEGRTHSATWVRVLPGAEQPFDVVVMRGWLPGSDGVVRRGVVHTGVVVRKGCLVHTDLGYAVVVVGTNHPSVRRRIVGYYRHVLMGSGGGCPEPA